MLRNIAFAAILFSGATTVQAADVQSWSTTVIADGSAQSAVPATSELMAGDFRGTQKLPGPLGSGRVTDLSGPFNAAMRHVTPGDDGAWRLVGKAVLPNDGDMKRELLIYVDVMDAEGPHPVVSSVRVYKSVVIQGGTLFSWDDMKDVWSDLSYDASTGILSGVLSGQCDTSSIENVAISAVLAR